MNDQALPNSSSQSNAAASTADALIPQSPSTGAGDASDAKSEKDAALKKAASRLQQVEDRASSTAQMGLSTNQVLGIAITLGLMALTWWHAFSEMWHRWFPAWKRTNISLTSRMTEGDSYYTHGPLVPVASLVIAWLIFRRVGVPCRRTRSSNTGGAILLACSLLLQVIGGLADVTFVAGFAWIGVCASFIVIWGGWPLLRAYWLPVAFLAFMVPMPMSLIANINFALKQYASTAALWLTNNVFGIWATLDGSTVTLWNVEEGTSTTLIVENVCSGLRSLISLICFASLFALVCRVKGWWRIVMLLLAPPIAILTNVIRITILNVAAHHISVEVAGPGGWVHDFAGLAVFALALVIMFGIEALIIKLGKVYKRDWSDTQIMGYLDTLPKTGFGQMTTLRPVPLIALGIIGVASTYWALEAPSQNRSDVASSAVPLTATIAGHTYQSEDREMDKKTLTILQTNDYLYRHFYRDGSRVGVDMTIVFSANNRKGTHPPEVCLEGGGGRITSKQLQPVSFAGSSDASGAKRTIDMRELIVENSGREMLHVYTYKCGDSYTPNFFTQQATIFFNGLVMRNTAGALIRFDVPIVSGNVEDARALAVAAAEKLMVDVDKGLP